MNLLCVLLIVLIILAGIWYYRTYDMRSYRYDGYSHFTDAYGDHLPYAGDYLLTTGDEYEGKYEREGSNVDLCQECIGHCNVKVWAGIKKLQKGQSVKDACLKDCALECQQLDV